MANIIDYLDWRGDLSFEVSPFNEVDNYIVSKIGTADFGGIVPADGAVGIAYAAERLAELGRTSLGALASKSIIPCILSLPDYPRFEGLKLWGYENRFIPEKTEQLSALTVILPDGTNYVSFRGTDDTIVAWKEDFLMGVQDSVCAQHDALTYLLRAAESLEGPIIVGGHSKGGNLAVYAAANAPEELQDRIIAVINNDGPGFREEFLSSEGYLRIRDRVTTLISQHSIVGTLLVQDRTTVVRSNASGIAAHDGFNWEVRGTHFVRCESLSKASALLDIALQDAVDNMEPQEREEFVDGLFEILASTGAETVSDFSEKRLRKAVEMAGTFKKEKSVHKFLLAVLEQALREVRQDIRSHVP